MIELIMSRNSCCEILQIDDITIISVIFIYLFIYLFSYLFIYLFIICSAMWF